MYLRYVLGCALALMASVTSPPVKAQTPLPPRPPISHRSPSVAHPAVAELPPVPAVPAAATSPAGLLAEIRLADIGFINGLHFANLGGHRELFVPLPQNGEVTASELVLVLDDISAYDARRNLEVQVNDRTAAAIALDGKSHDRVVHVPLNRTRPKDGFLKIAFLYSGAATLDRCMDMRYVGDTLTVRPESAIEIDTGPIADLDVATTAELMPRDVAIVLPGRRVAATELATAVTVGRSLIADGRRVSFHHGYGDLQELVGPNTTGRWMRGIVLVGPIADAVSVIDAPLAKLAGPAQMFGMLAAVRVAGQPALLVSDSDAVRAGNLFSSPWLAATRGSVTTTVADAVAANLPNDRVSFDQLGIAPAQAEVFGRAELNVAVDRRHLPAGTRPKRLLLEVMVGSDGAGERAVVSVFINERLIASAVAATGEPTRLDIALPDGLFFTIANVRVLVQRDSAQGGCRFEPQGYPAQVLGSSSLVLEKADGALHDFADLTPRFGNGIELDLPAVMAEQPTLALSLLTEIAGQLSAETAPISVSFTAQGSVATPQAPFIAVSDGAPADATPRVQFDRGRVAVSDRAGKTLLDLGGFADAAVAQIVTAGAHPGLWVKPLSQDGSTPSPAELRLDRGDIAFIDGNGVALAMSSERDSVVQVSYPDRVTWLDVAQRFRPWIIAGLWFLGTAILLLTLQRVFRRKAAGRPD